MSIKPEENKTVPVYSRIPGDWNRDLLKKIEKNKDAFARVGVKGRASLVCWALGQLLAGKLKDPE